MVPDAVEGLTAEVEGCQGHVGSPTCVVVATLHVRGKGVLAGMAALIISAPLIYDQFTGLVGDALEQTESVIAR